MPSSYQEAKAWALMGIGIPSCMILSIFLAFKSDLIIGILDIVFFIISLIGITYMVHLHANDYKSCPMCTLPRNLHFPASMFALNFHQCTLTEEQI